MKGERPTTEEQIARWQARQAQKRQRLALLLQLERGDRWAWCKVHVIGGAAEALARLLQWVNR